MGSHVKMPCGWGCGESFGARSMAAHFRVCRCRPLKPLLLPDITPEMAADAVEIRSGVELAREYESNRTPIDYTIDGEPVRPMNFDEFVPCTEWTPLEWKLFRAYEEIRDKLAAERERCAKIVLAHPAAEPGELAELIRGGQ